MVSSSPKDSRNSDDGQGSGSTESQPLALGVAFGIKSDSYVVETFGQYLEVLFQLDLVATCALQLWNPLLQSDKKIDLKCILLPIGLQSALLLVADSDATDRRKSVRKPCMSGMDMDSMVRDFCTVFFGPIPPAITEKVLQRPSGCGDSHSRSSSSRYKQSQNSPGVSANNDATGYGMRAPTGQGTRWSPRTRPASPAMRQSPGLPNYDFRGSKGKIIGTLPQSTKQNVFIPGKGNFTVDTSKTLSRGNSDPTTTRFLQRLPTSNRKRDLQNILFGHSNSEVGKVEQVTSARKTRRCLQDLVKQAPLHLPTNLSTPDASDGMAQSVFDSASTSVTATYDSLGETLHSINNDDETIVDSVITNLSNDSSKDSTPMSSQENQNNTATLPSTSSNASTNFLPITNRYENFNSFDGTISENNSNLMIDYYISATGLSKSSEGYTNFDYFGGVDDSVSNGEVSKKSTTLFASVLNMATQCIYKNVIKPLSRSSSVGTPADSGVNSGASKIDSNKDSDQKANEKGSMSNGAQVVLNYQDLLAIKDSKDAAALPISKGVAPNGVQDDSFLAEACDKLTSYAVVVQQEEKELELQKQSCEKPITTHRKILDRLIQNYVIDEAIKESCKFVFEFSKPLPEKLQKCLISCVVLKKVSPYACASIMVELSQSINKKNRSKGVVSQSKQKSSEKNKKVVKHSKTKLKNAVAVVQDISEVVFDCLKEIITRKARADVTSYSILAMSSLVLVFYLVESRRLCPSRKNVSKVSNKFMKKDLKLMELSLNRISLAIQNPAIVNIFENCNPKLFFNSDLNLEVENFEKTFRIPSKRNAVGSSKTFDMQHVVQLVYRLYRSSWEEETEPLKVDTKLSDRLWLSMEETIFKYDDVYQRNKITPLKAPRKSGQSSIADANDDQVPKIKGLRAISASRRLRTLSNMTQIPTKVEPVAVASSTKPVTIKPAVVSNKPAIRNNLAITRRTNSILNPSTNKTNPIRQGVNGHRTDMGQKKRITVDHETVTKINTSFYHKAITEAINKSAKDKGMSEIARKRKHLMDKTGHSELMKKAKLNSCSINSSNSLDTPLPSGKTVIPDTMMSQSSVIDGTPSTQRSYTIGSVVQDTPMDQIERRGSYQYYDTSTPIRPIRDKLLFSQDTDASSDSNPSNSLDGSKSSTPCKGTTQTKEKVLEKAINALQASPDKRFFDKFVKPQPMNPANSSHIGNREVVLQSKQIIYSSQSDNTRPISKPTSYPSIVNEPSSAYDLANFSSNDSQDESAKAELPPRTSKKTRSLRASKGNRGRGIAETSAIYVDTSPATRMKLGESPLPFSGSSSEGSNRSMGRPMGTTIEIPEMLASNTSNRSYSKHEMSSPRNRASLANNLYFSMQSPVRSQPVSQEAAPASPDTPETIVSSDVESSPEKV